MASEGNPTPEASLLPATAEPAPSPAPVQPDENDESGAMSEDAESFHSGGEDFVAEQDEGVLSSGASTGKDAGRLKGEVVGEGGGAATAVADDSGSADVGGNGTGLDAVEAPMSPQGGAGDPVSVVDVEKAPELDTADSVPDGSVKEAMLSQNSDVNSDSSSKLEGEPVEAVPRNEVSPAGSSLPEGAVAQETTASVEPTLPSDKAGGDDEVANVAKVAAAPTDEGGVYKETGGASPDVNDAPSDGDVGSDSPDQQAKDLPSPVIENVETSDQQGDASTTVQDPIPEGSSEVSVPIAADNAEETKEKPSVVSNPIAADNTEEVKEKSSAEPIQPEADLNGISSEQVEPLPSSAAGSVVEDGSSGLRTFGAAVDNSLSDIHQGVKPDGGFSDNGNGKRSLEPTEVEQEGENEISENPNSTDTGVEPKVELNGAVTDDEEVPADGEFSPTSRSPGTDGVTDLPGDDGNLATIQAKEGLSIEDDDEQESGVSSDEPAKVTILDSSEAAKQLLKELTEGSSAANSSFESSRDFSPQMDGQIVSDSDEEAETDDEEDGKELFDSAALAALLRAASDASSDGNVTVTGSDASRIFSVDRPAGLGFSAPSLRPGPARSLRPNLASPSDLTTVGETENNMDEEEKKLHEKVDNIRVKFLRLVHRLGHSPEDTVAAQVLYRLGLAEGIKRGRPTSRIFGIESAKKKALQLEESGDEPLEFSCNILVLGKSGVGKSSTINSIFGEQVASIDPFRPSTTCVKEIVGVVDGVKIRFIDTPGLRPSVMDQSFNKKILSSIKKYTKKCPPDIVLYVDRLDTQTRDLNDLPLLKSIASTLGSSIWFNAIVALTHAASAPPDGPNGTPLSYDVFVAQRSHIVQHSIRQAAGDMRLMNPVALVENHSSCRRNRIGQQVLPNGISWRPQLLLLCYSSKTLSEANSLLKLQDPYQGKLFGFRVRSPPLPYLLSSLLQSRAHPKAPNDQGDLGDSDVDLGELSDSDQDEEDEYDQLPPFKPLRKSQIAKLTKEQRKAYFDEYDYRVKLFQKKQWKDELRRLRELKKRGKGKVPAGYGEADDYDQDAAPAAVPVPLPDMVLPPTFDGDNPAYRYRFLEPTSTLLARPVLDTHGWDHDCGYDGVSLEENLALAARYPASVAVQITKDKKEFNVHLDSSIAAKHGENASTLAGFDIQSVGRQLAYILRSETKFKNFKKNKTAAGVSVTFLGENIATGLKVEDQVTIGKRLTLGGSTGAVRAQGDVAYGANLEVRLREKDFPIGQDVSTLGLSLMKWRGDLALGANLQSQFSLGRNSKTSVRVGLNNKRTGQITVRTSTSEQLQIALLGVIPIAMSIFRSIWPGESYLVQ